jgi:hypothetical protein
MAGAGIDHVKNEFQDVNCSREAEERYFQPLEKNKSILAELVHKIPRERVALEAVRKYDLEQMSKKA